MTARTGKTRYSRFAQWLHWVTAILVLIAFIVGEGGPEDRVYSAERAGQLRLHESLGLSVLLIVVVRVLWRVVDPAPEEPPVPAWMRWAAATGHGLLYLLLFAVPLTAIIGAWSEGHALTTYLGAIGPWFGWSHDFGASISDLHTWLGDAILWLAGVHAVAALGHHFLLKDRVLVSMLPWK
jgi:cytochrome b561